MEGKKLFELMADEIEEVLQGLETKRDAVADDIQQVDEDDPEGQELCDRLAIIESLIDKFSKGRE